MTNEDDMVLNALLAAAKEVAPSLPEEVIRNAYAIERRHQFDRTDLREDSLHELQRLLEAFINSDLPPSSVPVKGRKSGVERLIDLAAG